MTVPRRLDNRPRVLLVDDSAECRDLYALMLEQTATVLTASRGEDALTIACAEPLDAIVLDVMMPGMDGWRTCERLALAIEAAVQRRFGGMRRWARKPVTASMPAHVGDLPAHVLNVSYGGFCIEVDRVPTAPPSSFEITVPAAQPSLHAGTVWASRGRDEYWLCGAEITAAADTWRSLVDAAI